MGYGLGTRSYNRSTEKRTLDAQRHQATADYLAQADRPQLAVPLLCSCASRPWSHDLALHRELLAWEGDWRALWSLEWRSQWRRASRQEEIESITPIAMRTPTP